MTPSGPRVQRRKQRQLRSYQTVCSPGTCLVSYDVYVIFYLRYLSYRAHVYQRKTPRATLSRACSGTSDYAAHVSNMSLLSQTAHTPYLWCAMVYWFDQRRQPAWRCLISLLQIQWVSSCLVVCDHRDGYLSRMKNRHGRWDMRHTHFCTLRKMLGSRVLRAVVFAMIAAVSKFKGVKEY